MKRFLRRLFSGGGPPAASTSPRERFARRIAAALHKARPDCEVRVVSDLELRVRTPEGDEWSCFLESAWDLHRSDPARFDGLLDRFVGVWLQEPDAYPDAVDPSRIVPVVKDRPWLEETRAHLVEHGGEDAARRVHEDLNEDLVILYAEDSPDSIRYLQPQDVERLGIDPAELRRLACENLERLLPKLETTVLRFDEGASLIRIDAGGDYEPSLLLYDKLWEGLRGRVIGDPVVAIPRKEILLITGSDDAPGLRTLRRTATAAWQEGAHRLTPNLFVHRNGRFEPFPESADPKPSDDAES